MFKKTLMALLLSTAASAFAVPLSSQHALVFEEDSGTVLLEKNAHDVVPIASITKVMTAMAVLDARLDMNELITIDQSDVDTLKHSSSRVPVGTVLTRKALLELALMSSDNRAAAALARTFPGSHAGFVAAVKEKLNALDMRNTVIEEPTGLSPHNRSTAADLVKMVTAASHYPEIGQITTETGDLLDMNGRMVQYHNTNRLVGRDGWDILLSKTGFTREAGRCLVMRFQAAGKRVIVVLLNAKEGAARMVDAENVQRLLTGEPPLVARAAAPRATSRKVRGQQGSVMLVKAKGGNSGNKAISAKTRKKRPTM
ncbi:D-alanyl-D-alanine carboxypeptidase family protein [Noviherbaspirillum sp. Root189]|uniref:D-alanyl-D-alanine carboxypeptidase family protein n=1 Tax=Noviherbaspirillum sp. Root189 TaxID=1736487 RepID=UPI00070C2A01|nr:serine hydrolase [Noviherbaspirillum sp. Root189]KRB66397.1 peptidase S11 [Noviherbaspirillum sp. Root189]